MDQQATAASFPIPFSCTSVLSNHLTLVMQAGSLQLARPQLPCSFTGATRSNYICAARDGSLIVCDTEISVQGKCMVVLTSNRSSRFYPVEQERLLLEEDNLFHIILLWWELIMPTSRKIKRVLTETYYFEILGLRFWKVLISTFSWGQSVLSKFKSKKRTRPSKNSVSFLFLINGDWLTWRIRTDNFGLLGKLINHILIPHWLLKNKPD